MTPSGRLFAMVEPAMPLERSLGYNLAMSTLAEIEAAVDALPPADQQELLLYLATRLRGQAGPLPGVRKFTREQVNTWIAKDEAEMQRLGDRDIEAK